MTYPPLTGWVDGARAQNEYELEGARGLGEGAQFEGGPARTGPARTRPALATSLPEAKSAAALRKRRSPNRALRRGRSRRGPAGGNRERTGRSRIGRRTPRREIG